MKVAVIGSRNLSVSHLDKFLPPDTTEIVSGGAKGIDSCARRYAEIQGLPLTEFIPNYERYGHCAPLRRNDEIVTYSDMVLAFWDGESPGTKYVIERCRTSRKPMWIFLDDNGSFISLYPTQTTPKA